MRPKAEWAIDLEAMRARGIIVLVKSNYLVKNIENNNNNKKRLSYLKLDFNPFFAAKKPALFATSGL